MYLRLTEERIKILLNMEQWTEAQREGAVVRHAYRDHARELAELKAKRERLVWVEGERCHIQEPC
jgi:hypothetical protein